METKKCSKCNEEKILSNFHKRSGGYLRSRCVDCSKHDRKVYEEKNEEKIKEGYKQDYIKRKGYKQDYIKRKGYKQDYNKKYRDRNKDSESKRNAKWVSENRESINKRNIKYRNEKIKDPLYKLKENIRSLIRISIKSRGFNKSTKTFNILGCSIDEFKIHIEKLFEPNMSWDNYPEWQLDHKIPISWAKNEEDILKLNHHTNFQPKWAFDNLSKSNRYSD